MKYLSNMFPPISVHEGPTIEKSHFDEHYGFRNIPVLFTKCFSGLELDSSGSLTCLDIPEYLECWYERYASGPLTKPKNIILGENSGPLDFRKNIWNLSSWHYLIRGSIEWLFLPPVILEYLQLNHKIPEASEKQALRIDIANLSEKYGIQPLRASQSAGNLLYVPPQYAYSQNIGPNADIFSKTILTEYNHDQLYAYFRNSESKTEVKKTILNGFTNTKHLSVYDIRPKS